MDRRFITLYALATRLGLPRRFLREQARGVIPYLLVGGRMRFEESAVCERCAGSGAQPADGDAGTEGEHAHWMNMSPRPT